MVTWMTPLDSSTPDRDRADHPLRHDRLDQPGDVAFGIRRPHGTGELAEVPAEHPHLLLLDTERHHPLAASGLEVEHTLTRARRWRRG